MNTISGLTMSRMSSHARMLLRLAPFLLLSLTSACGGGSAGAAAGKASVEISCGGCTVTTLAGSGGAGGADGQGIAAQFNDPEGVAVDAAGIVYIADTDNHRIRKIDPGGL